MHKNVLRIDAIIGDEHEQEIVKETLEDKFNEKLSDTRMHGPDEEQIRFVLLFNDKVDHRTIEDQASRVLKANYVSDWDFLWTIPAEELDLDI